MAEFVLIHGAAHRAGVWKAVMPYLSALGHSAMAISLSGNTLDDHARAIRAHSMQGALLVGHSAGGFAAHAAAVAFPGYFSGLIYLCAFIPSAGNSVADLRRAAPKDALGPALRRIGAGYGFDSDQAADLFYHDCPNPAACADALRTDPVGPVQTALPPLPAHLPRATIICDADRAIDAAYQLQMAADIPMRVHLPCGHSPFFAVPELLAQTLHDLADILGRR